MGPIHEACSRGFLNIVKFLISKGSDIEAKYIGGYRPIHLATYNGSIELVKYLTDNGCDINVLDEEGYTPFHYACKNDSLELMQLFIELKCDFKTINKYGCSPLHYTSDLGIAKYMIENGVEIDIKDDIGYTPFHYACFRNNLKLMKLFIKLKCDIEAINNKGKRPIHIAASFNLNTIVEELIAKNCSLECVDNNNDTALALARHHSDCLYLLKIMFERERSKNKLNNFNYEDEEFESEIKELVCCNCEKNPLRYILDCGHTICESCMNEVKICCQCQSRVVNPWKLYNIAE